MNGVSEAPFAELAELLEPSPDHRVLRRFEPRPIYSAELAEPRNVRHALYVDCETTGLDTDSDEIIELALVPFRFDAGTGSVLDVSTPTSFFQEPTRPITPAITDITGITPEMVAGQHINDALVGALTQEAALTIAHAARFDRRIMERRYPSLAKKHWACSQEDVDWRRFGVTGGALVNIAMSACGVFTDGAHRAAHDCQLGIHVLATAMLDGRPAMSYLLQSARTSLRRLRALESPRWAKTWLKANGYHALYRGDEFQYWYKDFRHDATHEEIEVELAHCQEHAHASPDVVLISGTDRYSERA